MKNLLPEKIIPLARSRAINVITKINFFLLLISVVLLSHTNLYAQQKTITGTVSSGRGPLVGVNVALKGSAIAGNTTADGKYSISLPTETGTLVFNYLGFLPKEVIVTAETRAPLNVTLEEDMQLLSEVIVTGYGTQKRESITGSVSSITSKDLEKVLGGSQVSTGLAGKLTGVTFRQTDGRPGSTANIQIRNMGTPLFIINGIQQDETQFNNLASGDVESITILKDASAAVYGLRAANGVVVVTTKTGTKNLRNTIGINLNTGFQNWTRFPRVVNDSYEWYLGKVDAEVNNAGTTLVTQAELDKYKAGTERGYQSFDWKDFIVQHNAPMYTQSINASGGSDKINYYFSGSNLFQYSVLGREFTFGRKNLALNVDANITNRLKVGAALNGYNNVQDNPGIPGGDDYNLPKQAILQNRPWERPYANDNPEYLNDIGHNETNWAYNNKKLGGYSNTRTRYASALFKAQYDIPFVKGLQAKGSYSYSLSDLLKDGHEYTYKAYTYIPSTDTYVHTGGSINPFRERDAVKNERNNYQIGFNYNNTFGKHEVSGLLISERYDVLNKRVYVHTVPTTNVLPLMYFPTMDRYDDTQTLQARIGYIGKLNYAFANKYFLEFSGRRDASWKFAPGKRVGYFPAGSVGWTITQEKFMQSLLGENSKLDNLKLRASYGIVGDDNNGVNDTDWMPGYNYNQGYGILDGKAIIGSRDKGIPVTNITWYKSKIFNVGADFSLFNNKVSGSAEYFNRTRTGLRGAKYDILLPSEIGYSLPDENVNSDVRSGVEADFAYRGKIRSVEFNIGTNIGYARPKSLHTYKPIFFNSWDKYRNSNEERYSDLFWAYDVVGQFQSIDEINNHPINNDGQGNKTLLPGDLIYKDLDGNGKIDTYDQRPLGYGTGNPVINGGLNLSFRWKGFDLVSDFSYGTLYTWNQAADMRIAYPRSGGALNVILTDRWHRTDPFDLSSTWIPGKYPPIRFNVTSHSSVNKDSSFWLHNVKSLRSRTIELGYAMPQSILGKVNIQKARVYVNTYNLFAIDNLRSYGIDPEVSGTNGLQYPQNLVINLGVNLTL